MTRALCYSSRSFFVACCLKGTRGVPDGAATTFPAVSDPVFGLLAPAGFGIVSSDRCPKQVFSAVMADVKTVMAFCSTRPVLRSSAPPYVWRARSLSSETAVGARNGLGPDLHLQASLRLPGYRVFPARALARPSMSHTEQSATAGAVGDYSSLPLARSTTPLRSTLIVVAFSRAISSVFFNM